MPITASEQPIPARQRTPAELADIVRRIAQKVDTLRAEPIPSPREWAIRPNHDRDDHYFEELCYHMFAAGFSREVVRQKWPAIGEAFHGFALEKVAAMRDHTLARIAQDRGVIRNRRKLTAVRDNAIKVRLLADEHGSWSAWLKQYPATELFALHREIARHFDCVGPSAGEWFLLTCGFPYYFATDAARRVLRRIGLIGRGRTKAAQFNSLMMDLQAVGGRSAWHISVDLMQLGNGFRVSETICAEGAPHCAKCLLWDHCDTFNQRIEPL